MAKIRRGYDDELTASVGRLRGVPRPEAHPYNEEEYPFGRGGIYEIPDGSAQQTDGGAPQTRSSKWSGRG